MPHFTSISFARILVSVSCLFSWVASATSLQAATINASSCAQTDVQSAITSASDGDTVAVPSGNCTWSSGITISGKGIHLKGSGGGRVEGSSTTSRSIGTGSKNFTLAAGTAITGFTLGETVRARVKYNASDWMEGTVTGWSSNTLTLNVTSSGGSGTFAAWTFEMPATSNITVSGTGISITEDVSHNVEVSHFRFIGGNPTIEFFSGNGKPVLIHDNRFSEKARGIQAYTNRGVIWQNYFDAGFDWDNEPNNLVTESAIKNKHGDENDSTWTTSHTLGSTDTSGLSNLYVEKNFFTGHTTECTDFDDNSRTVWRYNILDNSGLGSHGQDTSVAGNRHFEVYNNIFIFDDLGSSTANINYWLYWRGGSGIVTGNTMPDITSSEWGDKGEVVLTVQQLRRNAGLNACWNSGYPAPRQPGQGHDGTSTTTEGAYIWSNTGSPSISLDNYSPDECGGGPDISTYLQLGRDYFTSAKSGYTPFTYPHPLTSNDTTAPTNQDTVFASNATAGGGGSVPIVSSGDATNAVWFAPSGTTSFAAGTTMTTTGGTATSIAAPVTAGDYKLFVVDASGNISNPSTATLTVDTSVPARSAGSPSGTLTAGTTTATLSLTTTAAATCKYGSTASTTYASIIHTFSVTGATTHTENINGLSDGTSYVYYVRCQSSGTGNQNTDDYTISFSVASNSPGNNNGGSDGNSKHRKKKKKSSRSIKNSSSTIAFGQVIVQSGKRFSKSSPILLYFSKPGGGYYPPTRLITTKSGTFSIAYQVKKQSGNYSWYAFDIRKGKASKIKTYTVR